MKNKEIKKNILFILKWASLFFILKLFFWSFKFNYGGGGGWIDLSIGPTGYEFSWHWNNTVAVFLLVFLYYILKLKYSYKKIILFFLLLVLSIFGKEVTYQVSPNLKFYFTDRYLNNVYKDGVFNVDKYLKYIDKYCVIDKSNWHFAGESVYNLCANRLLLPEKTGTYRDVIKALEYAKSINNGHLYRTFLPNKSFVELEQLIEVYNDKTFQLSLIRKTLLEKDIINEIKKWSTSDDVKNFIILYNEYFKEYNLQKENIEGFYKWEEILRNFENNIDEEIKNINGINHKLFY